MPEFTGQRDLRAYARVLWRWKYLFLAFVIVCPLAAYLLGRGKPNVYQSTALVGVNQASVDTTLLNNGGGFSTTNVLAIAQLVKTSPVADVAAGFMHPRADPAQIASEVTASGDPTTNFLTIAAQDTSPVRAAQIANAFAKSIGLNRQNAAVQELDGAIAGIRTQLSHLKANHSGIRATLQQQLTQLKAAASSQSSEAAVLQAATPNFAPVGPHLRRTVELGFVIGLLLAFGAVVLAESADRRMRTPDDLEGMTDLPLLASIPVSAFGEGLEIDPVDEETFQMLRTSLTYFNVDQALRSVLITSPGEKEGKTTVASRLAIASARAGSQVIVVDADLRRAGTTDRFDADGPTGLGTVLTGQSALRDALRDVQLPEDSVGHLRVLPAGPAPPNPSALMSSERIQELIRELESMCDLVIIDSPAVLAVSDAVPLMKSVTGVVLVARLNQSDQATVRRLQQVVSSAQGNLLGVVATGVPNALGYKRYTRSYYSPRMRDGERKRWFGRRTSTDGSQNGQALEPTDRHPVGPRQD
jgi:capsular exopolysaccharide synthesis family protein